MIDWESILSVLVDGIVSVRLRRIPREVVERASSEAKPPSRPSGRRRTLPNGDAGEKHPRRLGPEM